MKSAPRRLLPALTLLAILVPLQAMAQMPPVRVISSVDLKVMNQGDVVVARVVLARAGDNGSSDIVVAVEDVLKGNGTPQTLLQLRQGPGRGLFTFDELSQMSRNGTRVLVIGDSFTPLDEKTLVVPTSGGEILRDPARVIDYIRQVLRSNQGNTRVDSFRIPLPAQFEGVAISNTFVEGSGLAPREILVPVDARLEKWAVETLISRKDYSRGFAALRHFPSPSNIAFVRTLLADSTYELVSPEYNNGIEIRHFRVRAGAYDLLKQWNVAADEPALREEIPRFESLETFNWQGDRVADLWPVVVAVSKNLRQFTAVSRTGPSEQQLALIESVQSLTSVFLRGSDKTDAMLIHIAKLRNLEQLSLSTSKVTDKGLGSLLALPKLATVDLFQTRVTNKGLRMLAEIPTLKSVTVALTQVTRQGVAEARARRPDLEIIWERPMTGGIHESAQRGDIDGIRTAVDGGRGGVGTNRLPNLVDLAGNTPLVYAVAQNQVDIARYLLDEGARVNAQDIGGATPLQWATRHGYEEMMTLLLDRRANVNHRDEEGNTALHFAVEEGNLEPTRLLIARGANVSTRNSAGETPLDVAKRLGNPTIIQLLQGIPTVR